MSFRLSHSRQIDFFYPKEVEVSPPVQHRGSGSLCAQPEGHRSASRLHTCCLFLCKRAGGLLFSFQPPLALFSPPTRDFYHFLKKNCQGLCQMSSYKSIKSTGAFKSKWQKTASVDLTVKTSLTCPASVWFWFWFTIIRLLKGQHHSARDSMG